MQSKSSKLRRILQIAVNAMVEFNEQRTREKGKENKPARNISLRVRVG